MDTTVARLLARIGGFSARRRWTVVIAWLIILGAAVFGAIKLSQPLTDGFDIPGLASIGTLDHVNSEFGSSGGSGKIVFAAPKGQRLTAADAGTIATLTRQIAAAPGVTTATDPFTATPKTLSPDGRIGYIALSLRSPDASAVTAKAITKAVDDSRGSGLTVEASSGLTIESSPSSSPLVGLVLALIILFITFGTLLAAGLPLVTALVGLGTSLTAIYAATSFVPINSVAPTLAILLALAVGIDYSLFIVSRHRRQLLDGMDVRDSLAHALGTAGTAVVFAALTVIIALAGLAVVNVPFLTQMGLSAALAVFVAMLISLTLTPALLSLAGRRLLSRRARKRLAAGTVRPSRRPARRWAQQIGRHPVVFGVGALALLVVLALPVLGLRLGLPNDGSQPSSTTERQAYDLLADGFGAGANGPIVVLASFPTAADLPTGGPVLVHTLEGVADVKAVYPSGTHGGDLLLTIIPKTGPSTTATETLVHALRAPGLTVGVDPAPTIRVTGQTAVAIDVSDRLLNALPLYLGLVAGFAFILLLIAFRSILIPLKATISFLLSLAATLGCTVAVFQWGWLGNLLGVDPAGPLLSFLPILLIGVLFGLSMDYEMFLLSGMREEHAHGAESRTAVVAGFALSAKVVAAAALIMIGVFGNGAVNGSTTIRPIAFALAVGVLIDAFVVRMALVPALMTLFGKASWWFPRWLDRIAPRVDIEGSSLEQPRVAATSLESSDLLPDPR